MSNDKLIEKLSEQIDVELYYSDSQKLVGKKEHTVDGAKLTRLARRIRKDLKETTVDSMQPNPSC